MYSCSEGVASNPGSHPAFRRLQYEKLDESLGSRLVRERTLVCHCHNFRGCIQLEKQIKLGHSQRTHQAGVVVEVDRERRLT